jgi:hypothetical protein
LEDSNFEDSPLKHRRRKIVHNLFAVVFLVSVLAGGARSIIMVYLCIRCKLILRERAPHTRTPQKWCPQPLSQREEMQGIQGEKRIEVPFLWR